MTNDEFLDLLDDITDRNVCRMTLITPEIMRLFCQHIHLSSVFDYYIDSQNYQVDYRKPTVSFEGVNERYQSYFLQLGGGHLIKFSTHLSDDEQFGEFLAEIFVAMKQMGLQLDTIAQIFLQAEANISTVGEQ
ncbi:MAG: hypothetical protein P1V21_24215 [Rhizobiaceae bacterium]|nr:hypothetical protein [Rhizobiaceae bacterium]